MFTNCWGGGGGWRDWSDTCRKYACCLYLRSIDCTIAPLSSWAHLMLAFQIILSLNDSSYHILKTSLPKIYLLSRWWRSHSLIILMVDLLTRLMPLIATFTSYHLDSAKLFGFYFAEYYFQRLFSSRWCCFILLTLLILFEFSGRC